MWKQRSRAVQKVRESIAPTMPHATRSKLGRLHLWASLCACLEHHHLQFEGQIFLCWPNFAMEVPNLRSRNHTFCTAALALACLSRTSRLCEYRARDTFTTHTRMHENGRGGV